MVIEAGFAGLNTKQGDLTTIRCNPASCPPSNQVFFITNKTYIMLHTGNILEIRETGAQVLD